MNIKSINRLLTSISYYYDCRSERQPFLQNPARIIRIKSSPKRLAHDLLDYNDLIRLFGVYNLKTPRHVRNKVILGLLIFQGLTYYELKNLMLEDFRFNEGTVLIRGNRTDSLKKGTLTRDLNLQAVQMVDLLDYLNIIRPKILSGKYLRSSGRNPGRNKRVKRTNQVMLIKGSPSLKNTLYHMFNELREQNPKVRNARQIRQSVISHWLTKYDLRIVQCMAGHRFVSSTEWYKRVDIELLRREIDTFHPLKKEHWKTDA